MENNQIEIEKLKLEIVSLKKINEIQVEKIMMLLDKLQEYENDKSN